MEQVQAQADKPLSAGFEPCVVLVVDDNDFNRDGVALYLRSLGMTTLEAGDEATAYAIAVTERPGAAVVDIVIPTTPRRTRLYRPQRRRPPGSPPESP